MLLIYSETITPRLQYITHLLFTELYGAGVTLTDRKDEVLSASGPVINYSGEEMPVGLQVRPSGLLAGKEVFEINVPLGTTGDLPCLFPDPEGPFPFDVFSACFYMVTRYEEYLSTKKDKVGRYKLSESIAKTGDFYHLPVVNLWAAALVSRLLEQYPSTELKPRTYQYVPTIDIDHAFAFRCRPFWRTMAGIGRSISHAHMSNVSDRLMVLTGFRKDPFDTYDYFLSYYKKLKLVPWVFMLYADYGGHDNNVKLRCPAFRDLLARLGEESRIGMHPSIASAHSVRRLEREYNGLSAATSREITGSRQHFLKFSFPNTFRRLISLGITDDFSMGFSGEPGFRAGIATPFRYFDLFRDEIMPLTIHPVTIMDVVFRDHLHLSPENSIARMKQLIDTVRSVNGECVTLWHNESFTGKGRWEGWNRVFEETTAYAADITT